MKLDRLARRTSSRAALGVLFAALLIPVADARALRSGSNSLASDDSNAQTHETRRVLTLAGGGFVRAKSRLAGEEWQYFDNGKWLAIPAMRVVRAADEKSLLGESEKFAKDVGKDLGARRVAYADWLFNSGLLTEGVKELDLVFGANADQREALDLVARISPLMRASRADATTDAGLDEWFKGASSFGPTMRELAVKQLAEHVDDARLLDHLRRSLKADAPQTRSFSALAMRRLHPGEDVRALLDRAVLDGSADVRKESALALRAAHEPAVILPLVRALESSNARVRSNAVEALDLAGYPAAIEPLISYYGAATAAQTASWKPPASNIFVGRQIAYVQDYDVEVASGAAIANPQVNTLVEGSVLDVRVISVFDVNMALEVRHVRDALQHLSLANPGDKPSDWVAWWNANSSRFASDAAKPSTGAGL